MSITPPNEPIDKNLVEIQLNPTTLIRNQTKISAAELIAQQYARWGYVPIEGKYIGEIGYDGVSPDIFRNQHCMYRVKFIDFAGNTVTTEVLLLDDLSTMDPATQKRQADVIKEQLQTDQQWVNTENCGPITRQFTADQCVTVFQVPRYEKQPTQPQWDTYAVSTWFRPQDPKIDEFVFLTTTKAFADQAGIALSSNGFGGKIDYANSVTAYQRSIQAFTTGK